MIKTWRVTITVPMNGAALVLIETTEVAVDAFGAIQRAIANLGSNASYLTVRVALA